MKCYNCGNLMQETIELIIHKGKTISQKIEKCGKCGKSSVSFDEYERVRKELHPSIFTKIRNLFKSDTEFVELFKGRIL